MSDAAPVSNFGDNTTLGAPGFVSGYGSAYNGAAPIGPVVGSYVSGPSGPPTVKVEEAAGFENVVIRVPRPQRDLVMRGPPTIQRRVVPGPVVQKVVPEYVAGPTRVVKEIVPGPVTYRDEKVEVPGPIVERIERVEIPGQVIERVVKEFIPGPVVEKEETYEVPGPIVYKDVKVEVPGPVIRRAVPTKVEVPGPIQVIRQPVPVPQPIIREVTVEQPVQVARPVPVKVEGPTREILVRQFDNLLHAENQRLRQEVEWLRRQPSAIESEIITERVVYGGSVAYGAQQQFAGQYSSSAYGSSYGAAQQFPVQYGAAQQYGQQYGAAQQYPVQYGAAQQYPQQFGAPQQFA